MALMTYQSEAMSTVVPTIELTANGFRELGSQSFIADQQFQIAVLTDFCNECGNCVTACPTSGEPYVDKPRLYLNREEFEAEKDNAFMLFGDGSIESRVGGETHRLAVIGSIEYTTPNANVTLDESMRPIEGKATNGSPTVELSMENAATMYTVWRGVVGSMPHIPLMAEASDAATVVPHPGYEE